MWSTHPLPSLWQPKCKCSSEVPGLRCRVSRLLANKGSVCPPFSLNTARDTPSVPCPRSDLQHSGAWDALMSGCARLLPAVPPTRSPHLPLASPLPRTVCPPAASGVCRNWTETGGLRAEPVRLPLPRPGISENVTGHEKGSLILQITFSGASPSLTLFSSVSKQLKVIVGNPNNTEKAGCAVPG